MMQCSVIHTFINTHFAYQIEQPSMLGNLLASEVLAWPLLPMDLIS